MKKVETLQQPYNWGSLVSSNDWTQTKQNRKIGNPRDFLAKKRRVSRLLVRFSLDELMKLLHSAGSAASLPRC